MTDFLKDALEPFAREMDRLTREYGDDRPDHQLQPLMIEMGAIKRLREALASAQSSSIHREGREDIEREAARWIDANIPADRFIEGPDGASVLITSDEATDLVRHVISLSVLSSSDILRSGDWRPIESAPKDGTKFDAWVPSRFGGFRMADLSFNAKGQLRQHGLLTVADLPRWPTHWMPLPPAPEPSPRSHTEEGRIDG